MNFEQWLIKQGWRRDRQNNRICQACKQRLIYGMGWSSPGYRFYHDTCFQGSKRGKILLMKYGEANHAA